MKTLIATGLALALPAAAFAHDYTLGDLEIIHPMIFETAASAKAGGGYLTIANDGKTDDALIGVAADFPGVMLHESYEEDGVMRMRHLDRLTVPADGIVELAPGGYHVMFMGLDEPLEAGDEVPAVLTFEEAGEIEVDFKVVERSDAMDHGGMTHSGHD